MTTTPTIRPIGFILAGLSIAIGPAIAGFFVYKGLTESRLADRYVTVKGLVERIEKSDYGTGDISYKMAGNDLVELNKELSSQVEVVQDSLMKFGFTDPEISTSSPVVTDLQAREWGDGHKAPYRYIVERSTYVNSPDVDKLAKMSTLVGELVDQGINLSRFGVTYQLKKFNELRPVLIAEATQNAKELAKQFAENSGSKVGGIRRANQGVMRIMGADTSPGNEYDTGEKSLMKKVRVVSTLDFFLLD